MSIFLLIFKVVASFILSRLTHKLTADMKGKGDVTGSEVSKAATRGGQTIIQHSDFHLFILKWTCIMNSLGNEWFNNPVYSALFTTCPCSMPV